MGDLVRGLVPFTGQLRGCLGTLLEFVGVATVLRCRVAEEERRNRSRCVPDVLRSFVREIEDQGLIDVEFNVEYVAQFVNPVVEVHTNESQRINASAQGVREIRVRGKLGEWTSTRRGKSG